LRAALAKEDLLTDLIENDFQFHQWKKLLIFLPLPKKNTSVVVIAAACWHDCELKGWN
jgi:hypothetical protein